MVSEVFLEITEEPAYISPLALASLSIVHLGAPFYSIIRGYNMLIGVLALQGAFLEHYTHLNKVRSEQDLDFDVTLVRTTEELKKCDALVLCGGESTVMLAQAARHPGLLEELTEFCQDPQKPVYGSCAGMILMADIDGVAGGKRPQKGLGAIPGMNIWRNLYGNQLASFEAQLEMPELSNPSLPFPAIFIRAPAIHSLAPTGKATGDVSFQPLCSLPPDLAADAPPSDGPLGPADEEALRVVAVRKGKKMATSFHPELSPDLRIHEYFVRKVCME
ncbi:hypothetical protein NliqN6_0764 [Naganishia liquefaciens]|uniref:Glutaminase n=1 Tax=Naganishia liquefaciens TaxID=104408 RepID=A0A8H3TNI3_9TREE|nr:hypothetical protein NliqN6_0764 [Naganishia liquefaciens]